MIDYRLHKNVCGEHGSEWFVRLVSVPNWVDRLDKVYFSLLGLLGDPTFMFVYGFQDTEPKGFWAQLPKYFNVPEWLEDRIYNLQLWLVTNTLACLKSDREQDLGIYIPIDQQAAAYLDPDWLSSEIAGEALDGITGVDDIQW